MIKKIGKMVKKLIILWKFVKFQKTLKQAFRQCGKVKSVFFHKEPTPLEPEEIPSKYFVPELIKVIVCTAFLYNCTYLMHF